MSKHFRIQIEDSGFHYERDQKRIDEESARDGIYEGITSAHNSCYSPPAMRLSPICISAVLLTAGCSTSRPPQNSVVERLIADTPRATVEGNTFIAPAGWTLTVRGPATILQPPEEDSRIVFVDIHAKDADEAVA